MPAATKKRRHGQPHKALHVTTYERLEEYLRAFASGHFHLLILVGAGGIMLPNHSPLVIAEQFGTLARLFPGRIELGLGRAPGTDQETVRALRRTPGAAERFADDVVELQGYFEPATSGQRVQAVPAAGTRVPLWILGSSTYGAALAADAIALEADFFAIGSNDLAMYTLAMDRAEADVSHLYDPLHPAVLRLIQFATEAALRLRMPVSVCGEMAGNPKLVPLLLGLGIRSFSMNAGSIPRVKQAVRALDIGDCARFARRVMEQSDPARIRELVTDFAEGLAARV